MTFSRLMRGALIMAACFLCVFAFALAEETEIEYVENQWNYLDMSMDVSHGIPEDAVGMLAKIRDTGVLRVALEAYYPPQEFIDESLPEGEQIVGADVELAKLIAERMGVELKIVPMDFSLVLSSVGDGECDLAISALSYTPSRSLLSTFSKGYYYSDDNSVIGLLVQEGDLEKIRSLDDLADKIIVAQSGSLQEALAAENILKYHEFRRMSTVQQVYLAVANRWADAAVVNVATTKSYIQNNPQQKLALVPDVQLLLQEEMTGDRVACKKGELQLMAFVNGVIDEMNAGKLYEGWMETYQAYWDRINPQ